MTTLSGIDVSGENGEFPWGEHEGISFAGIRATSWDGPSSFTRDPQLDRNAPAVWDLGKNRPRIYYHETSPGVTSPKSQARGFLNALGGHLCDGDMLAAAMEDAQGEPPSFIANWHQGFLSALNEYAPGHRVLAYCDPSWASQGNAAGLNRWHLWLADYGVQWPLAPAPWKAWKFWQDNGTGLDTDIYDGDLESLLDFARMPAWRR